MASHKKSMLEALPTPPGAYSHSRRRPDHRVLPPREPPSPRSLSPDAAREAKHGDDAERSERMQVDSPVAAIDNSPGPWRFHPHPPPPSPPAGAARVSPPPVCVCADGVHNALCMVHPAEKAECECYNGNQLMAYRCPVHPQASASPPKSPAASPPRSSADVRRPPCHHEAQPDFCLGCSELKCDGCGDLRKPDGNCPGGCCWGCCDDHVHCYDERTRTMQQGCECMICRAKMPFVPPHLPAARPRPSSPGVERRKAGEVRKRVRRSFSEVERALGSDVALPRAEALANVRMVDRAAELQAQFAREPEKKNKPRVVVDLLDSQATQEQYSPPPGPGRSIFRNGSPTCIMDHGQLDGALACQSCGYKPDSNCKTNHRRLGRDERCRECGF